MHDARDTRRTRADYSPMKHTRSPPGQRPLSWAQLLNALDQTDTVIRCILHRDVLARRARADLEQILREVSGPTLGKAGRRAMVDPVSRQLLGAKPPPRPRPRPQLPIADEGLPEDIAEWVKRSRRCRNSVKHGAVACSRETMIAAFREEVPEELPVEVAEEADAPNLAELPSRPAAETLTDAPAEPPPELRLPPHLSAPDAAEATEAAQQASQTESIRIPGVPVAGRGKRR
jgi:hypothetical protein